MKNLEIYVLTQDNERFERHGWVTKIVRIPIIWILGALPTQISRALFLAFSGPNGDARIACRWSATYKPLERMYTFWGRKAKGETNISDNFWELFLDNARAIRNRLKLFKRQLLKTIQETGQRKGKVNLLSLGSGSARGVFEIINSLNGQYPIGVKLIDMSKRALNFSKKLALSYGINDIEQHRDLAQNLEKYCDKDFQPDIAEMVGLLDYFPQKEALKLMREIYKVLSPGGWFLVSNVMPNLEVPFTAKAINWSVIYRSPKELKELLLESGFQKVQVIIEPLKVHVLAVCHKKRSCLTPEKMIKYRE